MRGAFDNHSVNVALLSFRYIIDEIMRKHVSSNTNNGYNKNNGACFKSCPNPFW